MPGYDDQDVFGNVFTMLLAGEDTTANTLSWALYLLARDPAAQQRLAAEADAVARRRTGSPKPPRTSTGCTSARPCSARRRG